MGAGSRKFYSKCPIRLETRWARGPVALIEGPKSIGDLLVNTGALETFWEIPQ
jgi:hypothetical protein